MTLRLKSRSRVGIEARTVVQAQAIERACAGRGANSGEIAVAFRLQREIGFTFDGDGDALVRRRPHAKRYRIAAYELSAYGIAAAVPGGCGLQAGMLHTHEAWRAA